MDRTTDRPDEDPAPEELEIDFANDSMGGPTTASHSAGLSSGLQPAGTKPGGGPGASEGSLGTGGGASGGEPHDKG